MNFIRIGIYDWIEYFKSAYTCSNFQRNITVPFTMPGVSILLYFKLIYLATKNPNVLKKTDDKEYA